MPVGPASGGGGGSAGDVRAGGAFVEISARDKLSAQLAGLMARTKAFAASLQQVGKVTAFAGAAAAAPLVAFFKAGVDRAEEVTKLADQFGYTADQMQRIKYAADVAAVSVEDVLRAPEKYGDLLAKAPILDGKTLANAVSANRALRAAWIGLQQALVPLVNALVPVVQGISEFIRNNPQLVTALAAAVAGVTVLGVAMFGLGTAIKVALSPFVLIPAAVAAVGYGLTRLAKYVFPETHAAAVSFFGDLAGLAGDTMTGIVAAIAKGDLALAWEVATAGALAVWKRFTAELTYVWVKVKDFIVDSFHEAMAGVKLIFNDLAAWIMRNDFTGLISGDMTDAEINAARDEIRNEIVGDLGAKEREARAFRDKQIADANAEAEAARKKLADKIGQAVGGAKGGDPVELGRRITATRGAFRLLGDASQQFGRTDGIETKQLIELVQIRKTLVHSEQLLVDMANNGRFK